MTDEFILQYFMDRQILKLAIPNILSNISVPLLSTVDTALMGRLSELHLGAVGLGAMIFNIAFWNFGFLRMGTTGLTAQAYGRNDPDEMIISLGKSILLAFAIGMGLILLHRPLTDLSLILMHVSPEQEFMIRSYIYIRVWAAPATLGLYALLGWFFGMQNAIYPLIITIAINLVNILISYSLITFYAMDIEGVAYGTVIAQYSGLALAFIFIAFRYRYLFINSKLKAISLFKDWGVFLNVNRDIFIRTIFLTLAFAFFYSQSSSSGAKILAVNVILLQFINWMSYGIDGLAFAAESLVGKYVGLKEPANIDRVINRIFVWSLGLAILFSFSFTGFGKMLFAVFSDDDALYDVAKPYMIWMGVLPLIAFASYIWDGIFVGLTASRSMRNSMFLSFVIYLSSYYLLRNLLGGHALWLSLSLFLISRAIVQYAMYKKDGWKLE